MTDITLAAGLVARAGFAYDTGSRAPRQEWLGPARQTNRSTDQEDAGESAPLRLVGHKVLAQGGSRAPVATGLPQAPSSSMGASAYAARAIASFSQQLGGNLAAKGLWIDTYA
jgi:hypothetical protein